MKTVRQSVIVHLMIPPENWGEDPKTVGLWNLPSATEVHFKLPAVADTSQLQDYILRVVIQDTVTFTDGTTD